MERFRNQAGIVYAITRDRVEQISQTLNQLGYRTLPYHAGLPEAARTRNQEALINDEIEAIVATVAFGMGIDKSNVRFVIHAEVPKSLEHYQQESGRAGRDGLEAECWLLYSGRDFLTWQRIIDNSRDESRAAALESLQKMRDYCVSTTCRHRQLVGHFGQTLDAECQACDVCLGKLTLSPDSLVLGQKILSCVVRCQRRFGAEQIHFGAEHITKVLAGSNEAKVVKFGHNQLSTWGLMKEVPRRQIRDWIDQLVAQGFLRSVGEYPVLTVTPTGWQALRGQTSPELSQPVVRDKEVTPARLVDSWEGVDRGLFDELRRLRAQLAKSTNVAAFIIFSDATLRDLARRRPTSREALLGVHGIGQHKSEAYGAAVLGLIDRYCREHDVAANVAVEMPMRRVDVANAAPNRTAIESFALFDEGLGIAEIAERLGRAPSTVNDYLLQYIHARKIADASRWAAPYEILQIETAARFNDTGRLKPVHEALHGRVSYETIRVVLQCARNREGQESSTNASR
jgi:ATP-dependent DNA helicase RecQ